MPQRRTGLGRGGQGRRDTRQDLQLDLMPCRLAGFVQRLDHRRGHGEHAGVAGRHHHHRTPKGCQLERVTGALHLFAVIGAVLHLIVAERPGHAHIGFIAQHIGATRQLGLHRRHHQVGGARPEADHREAATGTAELRHIQRLLGHAQGDVRVLLHLGESQRHAQRQRRLVQRRVGHVRVAGQQTGQGLHGKARVVQRRAYPRSQLRTRLAGSAHGLRIDQQLVGGGHTLGTAHVNR